MTIRVRNEPSGRRSTERGPADPRPGGRRGPGGHMGMMRGEKARDLKGTMRKLIAHLRPYWVALLVAVVIAIASTVASIVGPKTLGKATTLLFEGVMAQLTGSGEIDFAAISGIVLTVLALYLVSALSSYLQGWIMANVSTDIAYRFRKDIAAKINRMPLKYFDTTTHGEVLSRITNDVDTLNQTLSQSITQIITSVISVIGILIMMFSISWVMTLVALLIVPLSLAVVGLIVSRSQTYFKQRQDYLGHVNGHVEEMYGGHVVMKAFNGEAKSIQKFDEFNLPLYDAAWKSQFLSGLMMPVVFLNS
jgi:ATP-binding cassette subfamily B multidrug efflux pump